MIDQISSGSQPRPQWVTPKLTAGLTGIGLLAALYAAFTLPMTALPLYPKIFMVGALALSITWNLIISPRSFTAGYLGGLLLMLIGWRIAAVLDVASVTYLLFPAFIAFVAQFFDAMRADLSRGGAALMDWSQWQLAFIRIYIGFDMVPHLTEKLFTGPGGRALDVEYFATHGLPAPEGFVILAGLCEFGIAIGIGMGLLTRLAGFCAVLYFLVATLIGGHFFTGFIWASPNGGWEYPALMMALYLSYGVVGAGRFSLDHVLNEAKLMPGPLRRLAMRARRPSTSPQPPPT